MPPHETRLKRGGWYGWLFWGVAALFYLYEYFVRVFPSAVLPDLSEGLHFTTDELGWSMSAYLWVYAPMQLAVGALFDRFGTRWLMASALAACALGTLMLAEVTGLGSVSVARGIQGLGSAFAFVGAMYVATVWFPPQRLALIAGMTAGVGMLGQIAGQTPLVAAARDWGLDTVLLWTAWIGLGLAIVIVLVIPSRPSWFGDRFTDADEAEAVGMVRGILKVMSSVNLWMVGIISAVLYLPLSVLAALWGTTFIQQTGPFTMEQASVMITSLAVGALVGLPMAGFISDRLGSRRIPMLVGAVGGGLVMLLMLWPGLYGYMGLMVLMFLAGLLTGPQTVAFAVAMEVNAKSLRATSVACCNLLVMIIAAGIQVLIGWILSAEMRVGGTHTHRVLSDSLAHVTPEQFRWAMAVIPALYVMAIVLCLVIPETAPRRK